MDATRRRRTRDEARRLWYGRWRQERFARSAFQRGVHSAAKCSEASATPECRNREGASPLLFRTVE
jgi:hypothetical protein